MAEIPVPWMPKQTEWGRRTKWPEIDPSGNNANDAIPSIFNLSSSSTSTSASHTLSSQSCNFSVNYNKKFVSIKLSNKGLSFLSNFTKLIITHKYKKNNYSKQKLII